MLLKIAKKTNIIVKVSKKIVRRKIGNGKSKDKGRMQTADYKTGFVKSGQFMS